MTKLLLAAALVLATWFTFRGVGENQFVLLDDDIHISQNPYLRADNSMLGLWTKPYQGLYIPVTYSVWGLQKILFDRYWSTWHAGTQQGAKEAAASFFHWVNWTLHAATCLFVFALLLELVAVPWAAFTGALLFALHPVQVEPIAWVSGLKDVLSGFFAFASLYAYLRYSRTRKTAAYVLASIAYGLALLSKPSAVVVPLVAFALDVVGRGAPVRWSLSRLVPWAALALPLAWISKASQPTSNLTFVPPWSLRPFVALDAIAFYLAKVGLPIALSPDYGRSPYLVQNSLWKSLAWLVPPLLVVVLWRRPRQTKAAFLAFLLALVPVLGFVPFYFQEYSTVADRYLYLALIGPAAFVAWYLARRKSTVMYAAFLLSALPLAALSRAQVSWWHDSVSLFEHSLKVNPNSVLFHNNLGTLLEESGKPIDALYHYKEVLRLSPGNLAGHYNSGRVLARLGRLDLAEKEFQTVLEAAPGHPDVLLAYGIVLLRTNHLEKAQGPLLDALQMRPNHAETLTQVGVLKRLRGDCKGAMAYFDLALARRPDSPEANHGKGLCLKESGNAKLAVPYFERAAQRLPKWEGPKDALNDLKSARTSGRTP